MEQELYRIGNRYLGPLQKKDYKIPIDFLILGHPRSGTGYISKLFTSYGVNIGHETIDEHGISCWTFVTLNCNHFNGVPKSKSQKSIKGIARQDLKYRHLVHNVRNPFDVINSIYQTEANTHSQVFRLLHAVPKIDSNLDTLSQTILSVTRWNKMISELKPEIIFKVEDCAEEVKDYLEKLKFSVADSLFMDTQYNTRKKSKSNKLTIDDYKDVPAYILKELDEYCKTYGYKNILLND